MRRSALRLALATLALAGCHGCRNDHPFVPYSIDGGTGTPAAPGADAAQAQPPEGGAAFARQSGTPAPADAKTWTVDGLALTAPDGATFRQALVLDLDGDAQPDALALVEERAEPAGTLRPGLVLYRGGSSGVAAPLRLPLQVTSLDPRCARVEKLTRVGKRSAAVEIGEACLPGVSPVSPTREVMLLAWSGSLRTRLDLAVVDPPNAPALAFDLDGADADGDGLDDVTVRVSLEGGGPPFEPRPPVHATFRWFDRPAGMSRQPGEPEASFHAMAAVGAQRAAKPKEAATGLAVVQAGKVLFQAVCDESAGRRVTPVPPGAPLACEAGRALEELGLAEARAYVSLGDVLDAIAAVDAAGNPPAIRTAAKTTEATGWVTQLAPVVTATSLRAISALPLLGPDAMAWGAMRFEPSGSVLVRSTAGVVRVDPVQGDEVEATGIPVWGSSVASPDGKVRLVSATAPCHGATLEATLTMPDAGDATRIPLPLLAPLTAPCTSGSGVPVSLTPIAWGAGGLEAVVAGSPLLFSSFTAEGAKVGALLQPLGQPVTPGAPRSPDGRTTVVPTSQGIVVRGEKARILRARELDHGYLELRDCAVSDDASRVACVRGGRAFVGIWPVP